MKTPALDALLARWRLWLLPQNEKRLRAAINEDIRAAQVEAWREGYQARQNDLGAADTTPNPYAKKEVDHG